MDRSLLLSQNMPGTPLHGYSDLIMRAGSEGPMLPVPTFGMMLQYPDGSRQSWGTFDIDDVKQIRDIAQEFIEAHEGK